MTGGCNALLMEPAGAAELLFVVLLLAALLFAVESRCAVTELSGLTGLEPLTADLMGSGLSAASNLDWANKELDSIAQPIASIVAMRAVGQNCRSIILAT